MIWDRALQDTTLDYDGSEDAMPVVLTIGDMKTWMDRTRLISPEHRMLYVDFHELTPEMVVTLAPTLVVSPLLAMSFDCIDLAVLLQEAGFTGRYRAFSRPIPNPKLVRREIHDLCPDIDFDLMMLDDQTMESLPV